MDFPLAGRVDQAGTAFVTLNDVANSLRRAAAAHGEHEQIDGQDDATWTDWDAVYMVAEQAAEKLPQ